MSFQEFQKAPNRLTSREILFLFVAVVVIGLLLFGLAVGNRYLAAQLPEGGEFALLRTAGRAFLFDHIESYSSGVPDSVQEQVYGRTAVAGEDVYILDIPFHLLIVYFPLSLFPDAFTARVFWMAISEIAIAGFIYLNYRLLDRSVPAIFIGLIAIAVFLSHYTYRSFLEGSPLILLGLAYVGMLISLRAGQDEVAGAMMVLSAFEWEIGGLFLFFTALWVFWERRWRVFAGAGMLATLLLALSFFSYPGWVVPFLRAAWNSFRVGYGFSTHQLLDILSPRYGTILGWTSTAILVLALVYEWRATRDGDFNHFVWAACLTLAVTPLLGQPVEMDELFPLTLPILLVVIILRERWKKLGDGIAFLGLWFFFGLPWLILSNGVPDWIRLGKDEMLFLFWPVFSLLGLYWVRWWMIRPPRTWLDRYAFKERV